VGSSIEVGRISGALPVALRGVPAAQQLLLDIFDTVRGPLLVLDGELRVTHANRAFFHTFRVQPEHTIGRPLFSLGDGQWDISPLRALLIEKPIHIAQIYDLEVDHRFPGIGHKIMLLNARVVTQDPDEPRLILLAIDDVTDRRVADHRLKEQHIELQRSNAALDEFASVASHDLQEPLRKILSFGERLTRAVGGTLSGDAQHSLDRMLNAAARMRTLILDLLKYSQVATRVRTFVPTDLAAVTREVLSDLETVLAESGGVVEVGMLPVLEADEPQMRQLIQNLVGNAIKYRRPGVPPRVRVTSAPGPGARCTITVKDNGIGFNQTYAEKVFQMYERLHSRTEYDGSGIGLAICRRIVEQHGGVISAVSTVGEGATFTVTLPITQVATGTRP
jgi:signal transduction histidine kinase